MKKNWNKLVTALRKRLGAFHYVWVTEPQQDGYPHLHVLVAGQAVYKPEVLKLIEDLWRKKYHMGFVKLKSTDWKKGGIDGLSRYLTKYMTKGLKAGRKYSNVYGMSRQLRSMTVWKKPVCTVTEFGFISWDDGQMTFKPFWKISNDGLEKIPKGNEVYDQGYDLALEECIQFFEERGKDFLSF